MKNEDDNETNIEQEELINFDSSKQESKIKKYLKGTGMAFGFAGLAGAGCVYQIITFAVVAFTFVGFLLGSINMFADGAILGGLLLLFIGMPLACGIAQMFAPLIGLFGLLYLIYLLIMKIF